MLIIQPDRQLRVTSLASGSSGNALLIQYAGVALLIDAGLAQRTLERYLRGIDLAPADLCAIALTHEHGDHTHAAGPLARRHAIPVIANGPTHAALGDALAGVRCIALPTGASCAAGPFEISSFAVAHDAAEPVGYMVRAGRWCVGIAIDLGSWTPDVADALVPADLIIVEANHDYERLRAAPYDWRVKQRIYSPLGHLDNVECGRLLARLAADGRRRTAWLAHLSQEANSPQIAVKVVANVLALANIACVSVHALPRRAALTWETMHHAEQIGMFDD